MLYNLQTSEISGEKQTYKRCSGGKFTNSDIPSIAYYEQLITVYPDGETFIKEDVSNVFADLSNPTEEFPIINPVDGSTVGTATKQELFVMLYSHYIFEAKKRDEQNIE